MLVLAMWGCDGSSGSTTTEPPLPELQGVVAVLRWLDDATPVAEADARAGDSSPAHPDGGGATYFFDLLPSRISVTAEADGGSVASTGPDVIPGAVSGTHLAFVPNPLGTTVGDPTVAAEVSGGRVSVAIPPSSLVHAGSPVTESFDVVIVEPTADQRELVPGDQQWLSNDNELMPIRIVEVVSVRALRREDELDVGNDLKLTYTFQLPATSPVWTDPDNVKAWRHSTSAGFWVGGAPVLLDEATHTGTAELSALGWIALGFEAPDRPCLSGRAVSGGAPLPGVEIRGFQDGLMGVDRVTTLADGTFCLPTDDGATTSFRGLGFDNVRTAMYVGGGSGSGPLGDVALDSWADEDQDRTFDGPGGDCDDADPEVGPNVGLADGSWCGEPL